MRIGFWRGTSPTEIILTSFQVLPPNMTKSQHAQHNSKCSAAQRRALSVVHDLKHHVPPRGAQGFFSASVGSISSALSSPRLEALSTNFSQLGISQFADKGTMRWKVGKSLLIRRRKAALPPLSLPSPSVQRIADQPSAMPSTPLLNIAFPQRSPSFPVPVSVRTPTYRGNTDGKANQIKTSPLLWRGEDQFSNRS